MQYHEAVSYLDRLRHLRPKLGTETTASLLSELDNPHEGVTFVQIAGSNGKGSTARMLECILREAGYDVGLYTSPDLNDLRERIRVNGHKIPKCTVTDFVESIEATILDRSLDDDVPTFFEVLTVMALSHFGREDVDVAVLEVGIGGRYDATSVVDPVASAVTTVGLEHTDILGETVEEIARDKAQVAPANSNRPLVTGATGAALAAIRDETDVRTVGTADADADVVVSSGPASSPTETAVTIDGDGMAVTTTVPLVGSYQATNAGIAATLARQIADGDVAVSPITGEHVERGLRKATWPGRFEVVDRSPLSILDGAHNPAACSTLDEALDRFDYDDLHLVFGAMYDKDIRGMLAELPVADSVSLCRPAEDRAETTDTLAALFDGREDGSVSQFDSVLEATNATLDRAGSTDCVLITGSLSVVAEARDRWRTTAVPKRVESETMAETLLERSSVASSSAVDIRDRIVHQTISLRVRPTQAAVITEAMLRTGGTAAVSGSSPSLGRVETLLSGTREQFSTFLAELEDRGVGFEHVVDRIGRILDDTPVDSDGTSPIDTSPIDTGAQIDTNSTNVPWQSGPETTVMGILNVTPDSFHDGGAYQQLDDAVTRAETMVAAGAAIIDVGGESTRPGADPVSPAVERDRVVPVIETLTDRDLDAMVSIDTRRPSVASAAIDAGATLINDVTGLDDPDMRAVAAAEDVPVVLMHSIDAPVVPDRSVTYDDVVEDVLDELGERILLAERAGISRDRIVIDPGLGFGKASTESFELLSRLAEFTALDCPILVGHSQKSMYDAIDCGPDDRLSPTVAATALAAERGADIVRVHDVPENVAAVRTAMMMRERR